MAQKRLWLFTELQNHLSLCFTRGEKIGQFVFFFFFNFFPIFFFQFLYSSANRFSSTNLKNDNETSIFNFQLPISKKTKTKDSIYKENENQNLRPILNF